MHLLSCSRTYELLFLLLRIAVLLTYPAHAAKYHSTNSNEKQAQRFAMEPQDQTEIVGSRVILPCRVIDKTGLIQWTKDDFGLGVHRNLSGFDRYSMVGSDEEGKATKKSALILEFCQFNGFSLHFFLKQVTSH